MKGGDAWNHAVSVYGSANSQHAVGALPNGGTSNVISMNAQSGGSMFPLQPAVYNESNVAADQANVATSSTAAVNANAATSSTVATSSNATVGGARKGGNVLGEIAVPAGLLIANEFAKNRSRSYMNYNKSKNKNKLYSRSSRRSRRSSRRSRR